MSAYANELFLPHAAMADEFASMALDAVSQLPSGSRVLDIGCGSGDLIRRASRLGIEFVGVDISQPNIEAARTSCPSAQFYCDDFLSLHVGQFDVAFTNGVLHLIECPDERLVTTLSESLKSKGLLITSMPIASFKNKLLSWQRTIWRSLPIFFDNAAVWLASFFVSQPSLIRSRLIYLRMPPTRVLGRQFIAAMKSGGFCLERTTLSNARHPFKLDQAIAIWQRH